MSASADIGVIATLGFLGALVLLVGWLLSPCKRDEIDDDAQLQQAFALLERARRAPGGKWVRYRVTLVEAEPPTLQRGPIAIGGGTDKPPVIRKGV